MMVGRPPELGTLVVERVTGIEPALSAWEADVLPLNYTRASPRLTPLCRAWARPDIVPDERGGRSGWRTAQADLDARRGRQGTKARRHERPDPWQEPARLLAFLVLAQLRP